MILIVTESLLSDLDEFGISKNKYTKISISDLKDYRTPLFETENLKFVYDEFFQLTEENKLNLNHYKNFIFQIKKSNLNKYKDLSQEIEVLYSNLKKKTVNPWDLTNSIYNSKKNYVLHELKDFTSDENVFKTFLLYLTKELVRIKLLYKFDTQYISKILNEKIDFKYKDATTKKNRINENQIDKSLLLISKIENNLISSSFDSTVAKRFLVAIKKNLEI
jgi:hypothetical protein